MSLILGIVLGGIVLIVLFLIGMVAGAVYLMANLHKVFDPYTSYKANKRREERRKNRVWKMIFEKVFG